MKINLTDSHRRAQPSASFDAGSAEPAANFTDPSIVFALERTHAAWLKLSLWAFTIGVLAMNSNQMIAASTLGVRIRFPVFINGLVLATLAIMSIPLHSIVFEKRMSHFGGAHEFDNRRVVMLVSILLALTMASALVGSAVYGALEAVQVS